VAKKGGKINMFKFLKIGLLAIVLALSFSASAIAVEKSKVDSIVNYTRDLEAGEYNGFKVIKDKEQFFHALTDVIWLRAEENTGLHDNFRTTWRLHVLKVYTVPGASTDHRIVRVIFRDYTNFLSARSRGFEEWWMMDVEPDGLIEEHEKYYTGKEYVIIACKNDEGDCSPNWIIIPNYPPGFRNLDWRNPPLEELQEKFDREINYWVQVIWGKEEQ